jgi:hypothetical protein
MGHHREKANITTLLKNDSKKLTKKAKRYIILINVWNLGHYHTKCL